MRIGYACLTLGVPNTGYRSCRLQNAHGERLLEIIAHNLESLHNTLLYLDRQEIRLFRITSDLIPFGSSKGSEIEWWEIFADEFGKLGEEIKRLDLRVSMHPGQYTVLNSPHENVVEQAISDLRYHTRVLDSLNLGPEHKIILHIGGVYGDKEAAKDRFITVFDTLEDELRMRIVLENDDRAFTIADVLEIADAVRAPVVYDNLHNTLNPSDPHVSDRAWIERCNETWSVQDGTQKIHYSQQDPTRRRGSHSKTIRVEEFMEFYHALPEQNLDIMLEVKDKNLSAVKCQNCVSEERNPTRLQEEWVRYKNSVLERSPDHYTQIDELLGQEDYPVVEFYRLIEDGLEQPFCLETALKAAESIYGRFFDQATEKDRERFASLLENCRQGQKSPQRLKTALRQQAKKYNDQELLNSLYFVL